MSPSDRPGPPPAGADPAYSMDPADPADLTFRTDPVLRSDPTPRSDPSAPPTDRSEQGGPSKAARQAMVAALVSSGQVANQTQLRRRLAQAGCEATQPTLSRDLVELGAVKVRGPDGAAVYAILDETAAGPSDRARLVRLCQELLLAAEASANLVVLRTPPGAAQFFASAVDRADLSQVLGCVAGDDTVLAVTRDPLGGAEVAELFLEYARR